MHESRAAIWRSDTAAGLKGWTAELGCSSPASPTLHKTINVQKPCQRSHYKLLEAEGRNREAGRHSQTFRPWPCPWPASVALPLHCLASLARMALRQGWMDAPLAARDSAIGRAARYGPILIAALLLLLLVSAGMGQQARAGAWPLPFGAPTTGAKGGAAAAAIELSPIPPGCLHLQRVCMDQEKVGCLQ